MINKVFSFIVFSIFAIGINAQSQVETMLNDAEKYNAAYLSSDFEKYIDLTIPSVIKVGGGKDIMVENAREQYLMAISGGLNFESITPKKPSQIMIAGDDLHAILPQQVINVMGEAKFARTLYFLASSNDEGKTWTFLDLEPYDAKSIKTFVPSFTGELEIPEIELPTFIEN